jgi:YVTN family beta-propeller protein
MPDQSSGKEVGSPVKEELVQKELKVEFSVTPIQSKEIMEGEYATVEFRITDATTGLPVKALNPASWIDPHDEAAVSNQNACKEKIGLYLKGIVGMRPLLDLNSYFILVLNRDPSISVIDPLVGITGKTSLFAMVLLKKPGADWTKSSDQKWLYVTMPQANQVAVVSAETFKVAENIDAGDKPIRVALQPDEKYLWVGNDTREAGRSGVTVIDTNTRHRVAQIPTGNGHHEISFATDSRFAFVSNREDGTVSVIDIQKLQKIKDLKTGPLPISLAFSPLSQALYVADGKEGVITVVHADRHEVLARIKAKPGLGPQRFTPDGRWGFVVNLSEDAVHIVDTSTSRLVHTIQVGSQPYQVSLSREFAYVRCLGTERVSMINLSELQKGNVPPVTSFAAGTNAPKAAGELSIAAAITPSGEEASVLVVNPEDGTIDYYMEGMNAPMGNFRNYGHVPAAVEVVDRSLREAEPGVYSTKVRIPAAGMYDVAFLLDSPRISYCFSMSANANPLLKQEKTTLEIEYLIQDRRVKVGETVPLRFRLIDPKTREPKMGLKDVHVRYFLAPGILRKEVAVQEVAEGVYEALLSIPRSGVYYVYIASPSLKVRYADLPYLTLQAAEEKTGSNSLRSSNDQGSGVQ